MSKTDKTGNSGDFDAHMSDEDKLRKDALKQQQQHMDKVRVRKGRPPKFGGGKDPEETKPVTLADEEDDRKQLLTVDPKLIVGLRIYSPNRNGIPCGKTVKTDEFMAMHRQIRRERNNYLDRDGTHVEAGKLIRERKGRDVDTPKMLGGDRERARRASAVLKSIMIRLMPHEAEIAAGELSGNVLDAAMDRAATELQAATGCEIISAAAHRMSGHDLHIHIQYTMVVAEQKKLGKYSEAVQEWAREASQMAREELLAIRVDEPNPSAIGAMKRKLIKSGKLKPCPEERLIYRKIKGRRFMGNGCILGHSFRNKLNLVRLAQAAGDATLGERVIAKKDGLRGFAPIAEKTDEKLESQYLDLWLERVWRNAVTGQLSDDALARIRAAGIKAAKDYSEFGTTMPEAFDLEQRKLELEKEAYELGLAAQYDAYQNDLFREEVENTAQEKLEEMAKQIEAAEISTMAAKRAEKAALELVAEKDAHIQSLSKSVNDAATQMTLVETQAAVRARAEFEKERQKQDALVKTLKESAKFAEKLKAEVYKLLECVLKSEQVRLFLRGVPTLRKCIDKLATLIGFDLGPKME